MNEYVPYPYATGDLLNERNVYSYSPYHGRPFLKAWALARATAEVNSSLGRDLLVEETPTLEKIRSVRSRIQETQNSGAAWQELDRLVQRFEVTKRVHHQYTDKWRAVDKTKFHAMPAYVELAETVALAFEHTGQLTYLNVLLKIADTLSTLVGDLPSNLRPRVTDLIAREAAFIESLKARVQSFSVPKGTIIEPIVATDCDLPNFVLLACSSARSRAYLEALCHFHMPPREVLIMGEETDAARGPLTKERHWNGVFMPELQSSLVTICKQYGIPFTMLEERNVNAPSTMGAISKLDAEMVIYSGVGGQIVSADVLNAGPPFLHMHSGWLPEYRGSTAFYYAILNNDLPSVSAIFLDPGIDTGPILQRSAYPMPDGGMNVDLLYDTAIRADMLCRVLPGALEATNSEPKLVQTPDVGTTYYEIHPVLKHIALLSLTGEPM